MSQKVRKPQRAIETLADCQQGDTVEVYVGGGWKKVCLMFFIRNDPYVRDMVWVSESSVLPGQASGWNLDNKTLYGLSAHTPARRW